MLIDINYKIYCILSIVKIAEVMSLKYLQVSDTYIIVSCKYEKYLICLKSNKNSKRQQKYYTPRLKKKLFITTMKCFFCTLKKKKRCLGVIGNSIFFNGSLVNREFFNGIYILFNF